MSVQKLIASLCYIVCVLPTLNKTYLFIIYLCQLNVYPNKKLIAHLYISIWSEESSEKFRFALCSTEIQSKLKNFNSNTIERTEISVDGAAAELSEILFSAAKSSLNRCKVYKKNST